MKLLRWLGRWLRGRYYIARNWTLALYDQDFPCILGRKGGTWAKRLLYRLILSTEVLLLALALQVGMSVVGVVGGFGAGARFVWTRFDDIWRP